jgi:hypothetical protein
MEGGFPAVEALINQTQTSGMRYFRIENYRCRGKGNRFGDLGIARRYFCKSELMISIVHLEAQLGLCLASIPENQTHTG